MFFYGKINKDGDCQIRIPKLAELPDRSGRMVIEAIADSTYFQLYECDVELKTSVEIKMESLNTSNGAKPASKPEFERKLSITEIKKAEPVAELEPEVPLNPFILRKSKGR